MLKAVAFLLGLLTSAAFAMGYLHFHRVAPRTWSRQGFAVDAKAGPFAGLSGASGENGGSNADGAPRPGARPGTDLPLGGSYPLGFTPQGRDLEAAPAVADKLQAVPSEAPTAAVKINPDKACHTDSAADSEQSAGLSSESPASISVIKNPASTPHKTAAADDLRALQVFWKPFATRRSALGFAATVHSLTGIDVEVLERQPGRYVVAFRYADESDRLGVVEQIREKAGVSIEGDTP